MVAKPLRPPIRRKRNVDVRERCISELSGWLESKRERYFRAAEAAGLGGLVTADVPTVEELKETGFQIKTVRREVNPLTIPGVSWSLPAALEDRDEASRAALLLYESYGPACFVNSGAYPDLFDQNPPLWIQKAVLDRVFIPYLQGLASLAQPDPHLATIWAGRVLDLVERDELVYATFLPVAGLRVETLLVRGPLTLRPITADEIADLDEIAVGFRLGGGPMSSARVPRFVPERAVLEARESRPKTEPDRGGAVLMKRCVLVLQLLGFTPYGEGRAATVTEPIQLSGVRGSPIRLARNGHWRTVSGDDLQTALDLAPSIPEEVFASPRSRPSIALARFSTAVAERGSSDAILDYAIALEATLLPEDAAPELGFRFALFGAWYLAQEKDDRAQLFTRFSAVYKVRSDIAHGSRIRRPEELETVASDARELTAAVLLRALRAGWPTPDGLRAAALG